MIDGRRMAVGYAVCAAVLIGGVAFAQGGAECTVGDHIYDEAQGRRGRSVYDAQCAGCLSRWAIGGATSRISSRATFNLARQRNIMTSAQRAP